MSSNDELYRWQFQKLLTLLEEGQQGEAEELSHKILCHGTDMVRPLAEYVLDEPPHPRLAVLLELLGKMGDPRAIGVLLRFLDSHVKELRMQAAVGLGWLRARVAIEPLDQLEGNDPEPEVRREARVALEEILREFPNLRRLLKHHKPTTLGREDVVIDSESTIAKLQPLTDEHRRFLAGRLPRLLALKYKAVPLLREPGDVLVIAVPIDPEFEVMVDDLQRLTGCLVELRGWPLNLIYERLLTFYEWGDDDWVQFHEELTDEALCEIADIVLAAIAPAQPHAALPDCTDSVEAVQSFLSLCVQRGAVSAILERDRQSGEFHIVLNGREGARESLDPPPPNMGERFLEALKLLADCEEEINDAGQLAGRGSIRASHTGMDRPFVAVVRCESIDSHCIMALDFVDLDAN